MSKRLVSYRRLSHLYATDVEEKGLLVLRVEEKGLLG